MFFDVIGIYLNPEWGEGVGGLDEQVDAGGDGLVFEEPDDLKIQEHFR